MAVKGTLRDKQDKSFVASPTRESGTAQEVVVGSSSDSPVVVSHNVKWDSLEASFPDSVTDVWTYKLDSVIVMIVTVVYTSNGKNNILSIDKEIF